MRFPILATLLMILVTACAVSPGGGVVVGTTAGACAGPQLGLVTDDLQVIDIVPGSPAEVAGVQLGDQLLDLTWVRQVRAIECNDVIYLDASGSPLFIPRGVPPVIEPEHPDGPVPFTDREAIRNLMHSGALLSLRVRRGDEELTLEIPLYHTGTADSSTPTPVTTPLPTVTPIPAGANYDYF